MISPTILVLFKKWVSKVYRWVKITLTDIDSGKVIEVNGHNIEV